MNALLELYDAQMRRDPPQTPGLSVVRAAGLVRLTGPYECVVYTDLADAKADEAIDELIEALRGSKVSFEWKVHAHDRPADLAERLRRRGFKPDHPETLLILPIEQGLPAIPVNEAIEVRRVATEDDLDAFVEATKDIFDTDYGERRDGLMNRIRSGVASAHLAWLDGRVVGTGRLEMPQGRSFAGLYTGGVLADARGKGVYRTLVASRALEAKARGYRYLTTEAVEASRPILEKLGFQRLTEVQGWIFSAEPPQAR